MSKNKLYKAQGKKIMAMAILLVVGFFIIFSLLPNKQAFKTDTEKISEKTLENMINPFMNITIENGDCLAYALYYKEILNKNHPELDVRKINMAGICPIGTKECGEWEGIPHTYLIINGHGGECILDQHKLVCIQVI